MRLINFFSALILLTIIGVVYSCTKDAFINNKPTNLTANDRTCTTGFSSSELTSIGITHNDVVITLLENFDFEATNYQLELRNRIANEYPNLSQSEIDAAISFASNAPNFDLSDYTDKINDATLVNQFYSILVDRANNIQTISGFENSLDSLESEVNANLFCSDRDFMLTCIEVARNSSNLWAPVSIGGQGYYDEIESLAGLNGSVNDRFGGWKNVFGADLAGAATAFFEFGLGLTVPGTNAAVAGVIAWNAGTASAWAAIL